MYSRRLSDARPSRWMTDRRVGSSIGIYHRMLDRDVPYNARPSRWMPDRRVGSSTGIYRRKPRYRPGCPTVALEARPGFTVGNTRPSRWMPDRRVGSSIGIYIECSIGITIECPTVALDARPLRWKLDRDYRRIPRYRPGCPVIALEVGSSVIINFIRNFLREVMAEARRS